MGCCISRNKTPSAKKTEAESNSYFKAAENSKSLPLPPPLEEETVKEVLSVTPTSKPSFHNVENREIPSPSFPKIETDKLSSPPTPPPPPPSFPIKLEEANNKGRKTNLNTDLTVEEISEVSDMCSLSESVSTTTIGEGGRVDDGEVRQRVDRSPAKIHKKRPVGGEFTGRTEREKMSPARRFAQSPGRRNDNNAMKSSQVHHHHHHHHNPRDMGGTYTNRRRIQGSGGGVSRDPGEGSARRSRSPATRPGLGRSPSSRAVRSPGRIPTLGPENGRKPNESKGDEGNWPTNESLENPLVSLECFIFL